MMKYIRILWSVVAVWMMISCCLVVLGQDEKSEALKRISTLKVPFDVSVYLQDQDQEVRLCAIKRLSELGGEESGTILIQHYDTLPSGQPITDGKGQREKVAVIFALRSIMPHQERQFMLRALNTELMGIRKAERWGQSVYFPMDAAEAILGTLMEKNSDDTVIKSQLWSLFKDKSLGFHMRPQIAVALQEFEACAAGKRTVSDKVQYVTERLRPIPKFFIPWDIYKSEERRVEYARRPEVTAQLARLGTMADADEGVLEQGREKYLHWLGYQGVAPIVVLVSTKRLEKDQADVLMIIAAEVMWEHLKTVDVLSAADKDLVDALRKYADGMKDLGAFCRKYYMVQAIGGIKQTLPKLKEAEQPKQP